jgi:large subunit ribosomal protein L20
MTRVKRGTTANKRRRKMLAQVKGYRGQRKSKERAAHDAILHAGKYAFNDRRKKKRVMRTLWQIKINASARENGLSYSKLMGALKKSGIAVDRKILAELAEHRPVAFRAVVAAIEK